MTMEEIQNRVADFVAAWLDLKQESVSNEAIVDHMMDLLYEEDEDGDVLDIDQFTATATDHLRVMLQHVNEDVYNSGELS